MNRITEKDLQGVCDRINKVTGSPMQPWLRDETGRGGAQIGNYHISHAYGGVCLHQMTNAGGGVRTPLSGGYSTKRELYNEMRAFLRGLDHD